jgi:hypothetical protein
VDIAAVAAHTLCEGPERRLGVSPHILQALRFRLSDSHRLDPPANELAWGAANSQQHNIPLTPAINNIPSNRQKKIRE